MKRNHILLVALIVIMVIMFADPVYAGPGGFIAKGLFKSFWGKLLLAALTIILLPLILYIRFREYFAVRKAKNTLRKIGMINKDFDWLNLDKNVRNVFNRVYIAWSHENMEEVANYVSTWYWRNQQLVYLDEWKNNNLQNICKLESIHKVNPLFIDITENDKLEGSRIAFSITATIEDYLVDRTTGQVVQGTKGFDSEEKIWIMEYTEGKWLLDDIRDGQLSLAFAKMKNVVPETVLQPTNRITT